jgi:4-amino-4-deoxy-L-arabinose transferase-like glycosyltransferase
LRKFSYFPIKIFIFLVSILAGILIQKTMPSSFRQVESSDYVYTYRPAALNILAGKGYTLGSSQLVTFFPPGYAVILAGLFQLTQNILAEKTAILLLNLLAGGITTLLVYHLASMVFGNPAGLLAAFLWLTYPFYLWLVGNPNTELPFLVFFLASFICFWSALRTTHPKYRMLWLFFAGFFHAIALLIRPILIGMWILWGVFWLIWSIKAPKFGFFTTLLEICVFIMGIAILVIPWEIEVYRQTGTIVPISTAGSVGIRDGLTFGILTKGYRQDLNLPSDVSNLMEKIDSQTGDDSFLPELLEIAVKYPGAFSKLVLLKALRSWYATDSARFEAYIFPIQIIYLLLVLWGLVSAWKSRGIPRTYTAFVALTAFYFWLATTSALSILRYMIPAMCLLLTLVPAGVFQLPPLKRFLKR